MKKNRLRYYIGSIVILLAFYAIIFRPMDVLFYQDVPYLGFLKRGFYILLLSCFLCLCRILKGPTSSDRAVTIDMLGVLIVGFCAIMELCTGRGWYIDIAIAWALQSFIATLALAKFLEGKSLDD
ncbi:MAG: monovalent cation/H+ antiporter complex subunit F [Candidatus Omnitrophota bacterium]